MLVEDEKETDARENILAIANASFFFFILIDTHAWVEVRYFFHLG